jgi:hypothetical protein
VVPKIESSDGGRLEPSSSVPSHFEIPRKVKGKAKLNKYIKETLEPFSSDRVAMDHVLVHM